MKKTLLAKGLNLSVPPKKLNYGDFLHPFEQFYSSMMKDTSEDNTRESLKPVGASIKDAAFDCYHSYNPKSE